jgi:hypothetical protein
MLTTVLMLTTSAISSGRVAIAEVTRIAYASKIRVGQRVYACASVVSSEGYSMATTATGARDIISGS